MLKPNVSKYSDYNYLRAYSYTLNELKDIYTRFGIKWKKKLKKELIEECYIILRKQYYALKIQKCWRNYFIRLFNKTLGPASLHRKICNNVEDFLTTETMKEIDYYFFFSYKDTDGFIYGFSLISIYNLILKKDTKNPYTRNEFSIELIELVLRRIEYNRVLNKVDHAITPVKMTSTNKIISLFQKMDSLGNYTQAEWLLNLSNPMIRRFILELYDLWNYRAQLTREMKIAICPPLGTPFREIPIHLIQHNYPINIENLRNFCAVIIHQFINSSHEKENQSLGAIYILSAITLVNSNAADSMPWLYQSLL